MMIDDFRPKRPLSPDLPPPRVQQTPYLPPPVVIEPKSPLIDKPPKRLRHTKRTIIISACALVILAIISVIAWYFWALQPLKPGDASLRRVLVDKGDTSSIISSKLEDAGIVRSALAVRIYTDITSTKNKLQAGGYTLSPKQSVSEIISHLVQGKTDDYTVTIPPGLTLAQITVLLKKDGYSDAEISAAFASVTDPDLFVGKPAGSDLEGYIFPESYKLNATSGLGPVLTSAFTEFSSQVTKNNLIQGFASHNLNLFQGITLASIVQKEASDTDPGVQKQIAQVFLKRLADGNVLGSDVTYMYAAQKLGVTASPDLDSPYNTRKVGGLPPGPISNPSLLALMAVAYPAAGDYNYFVAGDDGNTYFAHTIEEHEANIKNYCKKLCSE